MNTKLQDKLKTVPNSSGVYFHKSKSGEVIYIGKASILKNRVKQYFRPLNKMDIKTQALLAEIEDIEWIETDSEIDALFLESEMVKRYMPRYNILLRDDKSQLFVRIDMQNDWPYVSFTRNPADDSADYFGPFFNAYALRKALRHLRKTFPYYVKPVNDRILNDLDSHLGLSPINISSKDYKANLRKLISYIKGNRKDIVNSLKREMNLAANDLDFEKAATIRNKIYNLNELQHRIMFGDKEFLDISKDQALNDLFELFSLKNIPSRIEGFDISHMSGSNVVASQVVFLNGVSSRKDYRKYKIKIDRNDDFYNMNEVIGRRLSVKNIKSWGKPNLFLIDGGKGQLDAALRASNNKNIKDIPFIGLAKRQEQIVVDRNRSVVNINYEKLKELDGYITKTDNFILINLPHNTHIIKLLQRIRDESHRFAVSYHSSLKRSAQTNSSIESISGLGPASRKKLIQTFGSVGIAKNATKEQIIDCLGEKKGNIFISSI